MNTNKNSYTIIYATIMVAVVALLLAIVSGALKGKQTENVELDKKKQILSSLNLNTKENADNLFNQYVKKGIIVNANGDVVSEDMDKAFHIDIAKMYSLPVEKRELPIYVAEVDGQTKYILSTRGAGLWGPIWGYIALNEDKNTVFGTYFSHAGETPGLGAEIAHEEFQHRFINKKIKNENNEFVSIAVVKAGQKDTHRDYVDGISGGTITSKGLESMLLNGIGQYKLFLNQQNIGGKE